MKKVAVVFGLLLSLIVPLSAYDLDKVTIEGRTIEDKLIYALGEEANWQIQVLEDGKPLENVKLKWQRRSDDAITESGNAISGVEPLHLTSTMTKPGFIHITVQLLDDNDQPVKRGIRTVEFTGGAGFAADTLKPGTTRPDDFDEFWQKQLAQLKSEPMQILEWREIEQNNPEVAVYDFKLSCPGSKRPASGYIVIPRNAKPKSLWADINFRGYGVTGSSIPALRTDRISVNVNAHGIENGQDSAYYKELGEGELKSYAFNNIENQSPKTSYLLGMILRDLQVLELVKTLPEFSGSIVVGGGSQGGFQALLMAALDPMVTRCGAYKPWLCDLGGGDHAERLKGWRPQYESGLDYFDPVHHAQNIKGTVYLQAGLGDYVCPPSGISVLYNQLDKAPKTISFEQGVPHHQNLPDTPKEVWKSEAQK